MFFFAEALQVHVNPHVHVVYAAFCVYKINPWKTNLGILMGQSHLSI